MDGDQLDIEDAVKAQSEGFLDGKVVLFKGDCLSVLASLPENSIDAVVCDPPYHLTSIVKRFGGKNAAPAKEGKTGAYARASAGFMGKCFHPATDIMTRAGWRPVADVVVGDVVATLNPDTREVEWLSVEQAHTYPFEGVLTHVRHRSAEQVVTPNHKVAVSFDGGSTLRLVEPGQLSGSFHLFGQASPISGEVGPVTIESVRIYGKNRSEHRIEREVFEPKAFFRFLGLWLGDGYAVSRAADHPANDFFGLNVKKTRKVEAIRAALEVLGINFTETDGEDGYTQFYCYNFALLGFLKGLGKAKGKHIPGWVFQRDAVELEELYRGLIDTDGTIQGDGQEVFFTSSPRLADDFQRLCFHTGRSAISIFKPGGKVVSIGGQQTVSGDAWSLSVLKPGKRLYCEESKRGRVLYEFPYTGLVHCIGVPRNHIVMSRFNGKPVWSGNSWDGGDIAFRVETWALVLRVLKPGGHLIAFSGTRTYHRMACAIEDAGFEIRDQIMWAYGSGFPKSHNVSKHIDKMFGVEREKTPTVAMPKKGDVGEISKNLRCAVCGKPRASGNPCTCPRKENEAVSDAAKQWDGWGTALKPSFEPMCLARKPLDGTVAENVMKWGVGALNIDACRVEADEARPVHEPTGRTGSVFGSGLEGSRRTGELQSIGRWPANLMHDNSPEVVAMFPDSDGQQGVVTGNEPTANGFSGAVAFSGMKARVGSAEPRNDSGSAARFFWSSKAAADDRLGSKHPTVKPIDLMEELIKLVCPKGGTVLDPFAGTGTTGEAAWRQGMKAVLIEREAEYQADIARRMELAVQPTKRAAVAKTKNKIENTVGLPLFGGEPDS